MISDLDPTLTALNTDITKFNTNPTEDAFLSLLERIAEVRISSLASESVIDLLTQRHQDLCVTWDAHLTALREVPTVPTAHELLEELRSALQQRAAPGTHPDLILNLDETITQIRVQLAEHGWTELDIENFLT